MSATVAQEVAQAAGPGTETARPSATGSGSYGQILRSSALIGGASAVNVAVGIVRAKASAVLLGPAGFGLMGMYQSILDLAQSLAGVGINASGVRQIAAAAGSGEAERVARTAAVLRRTSVVLGVAGAAALVALSGRVATLTFGDAGRASSVALLGLALLFRVVGDGWGALLQGLRRISDVARTAVIGGTVGTAVGIALVFAFRERGVAPALVAMTAASLVPSWWYGRKLTAPAAWPISASQVSREAQALLKLGLAFMASSMLMIGSAYVIRIAIVRRLGLDAAGFYQSAWTIGGFYVGFILQSMGADFYPRLTAVVADREKCNRLVNEQTLVSLLLAGPGVIATMTFAPVVLPLLYSGAFAGAAEVLRWICFGAALKVVTWPLGFVIVAEGKRVLFFAVEAAYSVVHVGLAVMLVAYAGVEGAGMAFFLSYVAHGCLVYPLVRRMSGFRWSAANVRLGLSFLAASGAVVGACRLLPYGAATALGALVCLATAVHSLRTLARLLPAERLPGPARRVLGWIGLAGQPRAQPPGDAP